MVVCGGSADARRLMASVFVRMFSYGWLAVVLFLYLFRLGFTEWQVGTLLTATLVGDLVITLYLTTQATRHGRRATLMVSAFGKMLAGAGLVWASVGRDDADDPPTAAQYWILVVAGTVGVLTPTGGDIGPFKAVEQAALSELVSREKEEMARDAAAQRRAGAAVAASAAAGTGKQAHIPILSGGTGGADDDLLDDADDGEDGSAADAAQHAAMHRAVMDGLNWMTAYYALIGAWALALGALASGVTAAWLQRPLPEGEAGWFSGYTDLQAYRVICVGYTVFGAVMALLFRGLSDAIEPDAYKVDTDDPKHSRVWAHLGLHRPGTIAVVAKLSALFVLDAFAGGLVMQTFLSYWFHARYGMSEDRLGALLLGANFLGGLSALVAAPMAARFGEINTMVFTHLPSNLLLLAVVFMPNWWSACAMLLARFSISQMDVPARSAYVNGVVARDERDAANGITNLIRSLGVSAAPVCLSWMIEGGAPAPDATLFGGGADSARVWWFAMPFLASGVIKVLYDALVYAVFNNHCCTCGNREVGSTSAAVAARVVQVTGARPTDVDHANSAAALSGTARYQSISDTDH